MEQIWSPHFPLLPTPVWGNIFLMLVMMTVMMMMAMMMLMTMITMFRTSEDHLGEEVGTVAKGTVIFPIEVAGSAPIGCLKHCYHDDIYDNDDNNLPLIGSLYCRDSKPDCLSAVLFCLAHLFSSSLLHTILAHLVDITIYDDDCDDIDI